MHGISGYISNQALNLIELCFSSRRIAKALRQYRINHEQFFVFRRISWEDDLEELDAERQQIVEDLQIRSGNMFNVLDFMLQDPYPEDTENLSEPNLTNAGANYNGIVGWPVRRHSAAAIWTAYWRGAVFECLNDVYVCI